MSKEQDLWQFIAGRLKNKESVVLLVVAESSGSSPGRAGYKMAVAADGELTGSIGGGVMEVALVERCREILGRNAGPDSLFQGKTVEQVHRKNSENASGMICSGSQTVVLKLITPKDLGEIKKILDSSANRQYKFLNITANSIQLIEQETLNSDDFEFETATAVDFHYRERLGPKNNLFIIGGGHCALALSELASKLDFHISIFDDRPRLNTVEKNKSADEKAIIEDYSTIGNFIRPGRNSYVVVMTLGYRTDEMVIRALFEKDFRYFGVLGSKSKMATLLKTLRGEGFDEKRLNQIRTPIGLPINSHTPEEIAVSIAAELIAVKNA